jgi:large subunit ribosomal protein L2
MRITRSGGRNHSGRITIRHRGGGGVRKYRIVDFKRALLDMDGRVERLEYDPIRRAHIALVSYAQLDGQKQYILAPIGVAPGDVVRASRKELLEIKPGNAMTLLHVPVGTWVHNIELTEGRGGQVCRAAGTTAQVLEKRDQEGYAVLRFRSREHRMVSLKCLVTVGAVSNPDAKNESLGKAGRRRMFATCVVVCHVSVVF